MQDLNDLQQWKKMKSTASEQISRRPFSELHQQGGDNDVEELYLQEALQSSVVPHICSIVSPIMSEAIERRVEYWKQKYEETEKKLQEVLRQTKCPTCQKENIRTTIPQNRKKRKYHPNRNMQAIVASAAASAIRRSKLATVPENTVLSQTVNQPSQSRRQASPMVGVHTIAPSNIAARSKEHEVKDSKNTSIIRDKKQLEQQQPLHHRSSSKSPQPETFKYVEVVRNQAERRSLNGHTCPECDAFANFLLQARDTNGDAIYDTKDIVQACSRHRSRLSQGGCYTPEGFWELSFVDSIERRKRRSTIYNDNADSRENLQRAFDA